VEISIAISKPAERVTQVAFVVHDNQKIPLATFLLSAKKLKSVIVFCSTKVSTKDLSRQLKKAGQSVEEIHSDLDQETRGQVLRQFKNRQVKILVATDILSRGIDVEDIDLVLNFDVPNDGEDYIHRIGRTARAASKGLAITFINQKSQNDFFQIEQLLGSPVKKAPIPEQFGEGPEYSPRTNRGGGNHRKPFKGKGKRMKK
jgi:superfamily II DNA/RNA helicase